jgi:molecular chaperone DnaK
MILVNRLSPKLEPEHIAKDLEGEESRLKKLKHEMYLVNDKNIEQEFSDGEANEEIDEIKNDIQAAKGGDPDAVEKADRHLKELKQRLDSMEYILEWPITLKKYNEIINNCKDIVDKYGNDEDKDQLETLEKEAKKAIDNKDLKRLKVITEEILGIRWAVLFRQPGFWVSAFQEIKSDPGRFTNQRRAEELIEEGSIALQRQDFDSLKNIMLELWSLMPSEEQEKVGDRVSDAGIRKI